MIKSPNGPGVFSTLSVDGPAFTGGFPGCKCRKLFKNFTYSIDENKLDLKKISKEILARDLELDPTCGYFNMVQSNT